MCTSIILHHPCCFGRNLDLEHSFDEQVVITPRNFPLKFCRLSPLKQHFSMIGMATVTSHYPLYAEAVNEKGLYMAGLNFPGNAHYETDIPDGFSAVTPWELIPWILGTCGSVSQAREKLSRFRPLAVPFSVNDSRQLPLAPLHWHLADQTQSLVLETVKEGVFLYDDSVGVLTNNPPFPFHQLNLCHYQGLSTTPVSNRLAPGIPLKKLSQGMGAVGLPGDASSLSRYVKAAFHKLNSPACENEISQVTQCFHLLEAVSMVRGSVITPEGLPDITRYSCCITPSDGTYYYRTCDNSRICAVKMSAENPDAKDLLCFPLHPDQDICFCN